jgi:hypothetical protein
VDGVNPDDQPPNLADSPTMRAALHEAFCEERPPQIRITQRGVYDMPAHVYHADPVAGGSLSSTGARKLLPPSCPALFKHYVDNGQPPKREFDIGHAVHSEILGVGEPVEVIEADGYRTKAAKAQRDEAYAAGRVPVLAHEWQAVKDIADTVRAHPVAGPLLDRDGPVEQVLVWQDPETGVMCRAMLDKQVTDGQRLIIVDVKSTASADPTSISKSVHTYGYGQQADWYLAGAKALGLHQGVEPAFVFVFVEKTPPHLVTVTYLDEDALTWGARLNGRALSIYRHCAATGHWPGYGADQLVKTSLPPWAIRQHEDAWERGDYDPITSQEIA